MYYCVKLVLIDVPESRQVPAGSRALSIAGKKRFLEMSRDTGLKTRLKMSCRRRKKKYENLRNS